MPVEFHDGTGTWMCSEFVTIFIRFVVGNVFATTCPVYKCVFNRSDFELTVPPAMNRSVGNTLLKFMQLVSSIIAS